MKLKTKIKLRKAFVAVCGVLFSSSMAHADQSQTGQGFMTRLKQVQTKLANNTEGGLGSFNAWANAVGGGWANATGPGGWANAWQNSGGWANAWSN